MFLLAPFLSRSQEKEGVWTDTLPTTVDLKNFNPGKKIVKAERGKVLMLFNQKDYLGKEIPADTLNVTPKYLDENKVVYLLKKGRVKIIRLYDGTVVPFFRHRLVQYGSQCEREFEFPDRVVFFMHLEVIGIYGAVKFQMPDSNLIRARKKIIPKKEFQYPEEFADLSNSEGFKMKNYFPALQNHHFVYRIPDDRYREDDTVGCKIARLEGREIFYFPREGFNKYPKLVDIQYSVIGEGIFFYRNDSVFTIECDYEKDIPEKQLVNAHLFFRANMKTGDSVKMDLGLDKKVITLLKKENLKCGDAFYENCLKFKLVTYWPETIYLEYFWLKENLGMVKWERATGRIDEMIKHYSDK